MSKEDEEEKSSISVFLYDKKIIDLRIRLQYENILMPTFFRILVDAFLAKDDRILSLISEWRDEVGKKRVNRHIRNMISKRKKTEKNFMITKDYLGKIYDRFVSDTEFDTILEDEDE
jgi:hypothetical protein